MARTGLPVAHFTLVALLTAGVALRGAQAAPAPVPLPDEEPAADPADPATPPDGTAPDPTEGTAPDPTEGTTATDTGEPDDGSGLGAIGKPKDKGPRGLGHGGQIGLSALLAFGYRGIFPYDKEPCSNDLSQEACSGRAPAVMDLGLTYGLTDDIEVLAEVRLGLEAEELTDETQIAFLPGLRFYFDPDSSFKFFLSGQVMIDNTDWDAAGVKSPDFGARFALGAAFDFVRNFGLYVQGAGSIGVRRWFSFQVDGGAGVQVRFP